MAMNSLYAHRDAASQPGCIGGRRKVSSRRYTLCHQQFKEGRVAARHYSSFLLRCWRSGKDGRAASIKLEHIQSGEVVRVTSWEEARLWLEKRANGPPAGKTE